MSHTYSSGGFNGDRASNEVSTSFTQLGRHAYVNLEHELLRERDPLKRRAAGTGKSHLHCKPLAISRQIQQWWSCFFSGIQQWWSRYVSDIQQWWSYFVSDIFVDADGAFDVNKKNMMHSRSILSKKEM